MESQGLNVLEGITGSFQYLTSTSNVNFVNGTFTGNITGSAISVTSSTAQEFILDNNSVGTPFIYSPTNLNLSASNAVVVTSSPFRLKSLTNAQTSSYTPQDGDLIFNSDRAAYMAYSGSNWQEIIISGFTASYASHSLSSSYAISSSTSENTFAFGLSTTSSISSPQDGDIIFDTTGSGSFAKKYLAYSGSEWHSFILDSDTITSASYAISSSTSENTFAFGLSTTSSISSPQDGDIIFDTTGSGSFAKKYLAYSGSEWHSFILDSDTITSASYAITSLSASYADYAITVSGSIETASLAYTASYVEASNIDGIVTSASYAITASHAVNFNPDATASYALNALTASHAITASYAANAGSADTGSLLTTASVATNVITFTKGDSSTFAITVDTGSGGGGGSTFPYTGNAQINGGLGVSGSVGFSYEATAGPSTWSSGGALMTPKYALAGVGTQNAGLAIGGFSGYPNTTGDCTEEYNGSSWSAGGTLSTARYDLAGAGTQNAGLVFGGCNGGIRVSCTEEYDGSLWTAGGALITARNRLAGAGTQDAGLAFGGRWGPNCEFDCTEEYNGSSWSAGGALITGRCELAGAGTQNAGLAFGGGPVFSGFSCTEEYDGSSWSTGGALITARCGLAGAGIQDAAKAFGGRTPATVSCTEEYDGTSWSAGGALITGRSSLAGAGTQDAALAFGGLTNTIVSCTEEYNSGVITTKTFDYSDTTGEVSATGSFTGSFSGDGSNLTGVISDPFPYTGSAIITGSLIVTGSISTDSTIEATASYTISSSISTNSVNSNTNSGSISWWSGTQAEFNIISSSAELGKIYFVI